MKKIEYIIIHCSDSIFGDTNTIRGWHLEKGWCDIGYNFVILNGMLKKTLYLEVLDGSIEVGRSLMANGAHARGYNHNSIGICLIGVKDFTAYQLHSSYNLCLNLMSQYDIPIKNVLGHYEIENAYGKTCPNLDMDDFRGELEYYKTLDNF